MIGTILAGRYEILERVGGGGMALVYKALDRLLNRHVAVKVLRQQFVHDEEFIRRFGREAQSAAALSHPNVVSIYDVGEEHDIYYIVMEYVEGHNLNEIIKNRAPLQPEEAVRIAIQICDALDHAHQNRIIHRDIKPHNILIGNNGRVKVTDFGIARAVTSSTITQTGSVLGSVHYFSPEHAKGISTGEKSDLYSLGIVLYQMLTGKLPFLGESPISVALKHLQEPFEEPRVINPHIPQSVENVILKSMRKNPSERYQSAKEMLYDLETCLQSDRIYEPKISFARMSYDDEQETRVMPAIRPEDAVTHQSLNRSTAGDVVPSPITDNDEQGVRNLRERPYSSNPSHSDQSSYTKPDKKWVKPTIWISVTLLFLGILIGVVFYVKSLLDVKEVVLPDLIKMTEEQAISELTKIQVNVEEVVREPKAGFEKGIVFNQSKPPNTTVKEGSSIKLYVSEGEPAKPFPELKGLTYEIAVKKLLDMGYDNNRITKDEEFSDSAEVGVVIGSTPESGVDVDPKTGTVKLIVSKGPQAFGMPNLIGKTKEEAVALIESSGLKLATDGIIEEYSYQPEGQVINQQPYDPNDPVTKDAEVRIYISSGYPPEALQYTYNLPIAPSEEGKETQIRIVVTDARGEDQDIGSKTISTTEVFAVPLVLAPNINGVVKVYRDGQYFDAYPVSYVDAKQGTIMIPEIEPNDSQPETENGPTEPIEGSTDPVDSEGEESVGSGGE